MIAFLQRELTGTIPDRFLNVADQLEMNIAIQLDEQAITYGELRQRVRCIANFFVHELGDQQKPVAVLYTSQKELIPLLVGIVNAGHIYSTLSANDPVMRIASVLENLAAPFLVVCDKKILSLAESVCPNGTKILLAEDVYLEQITPSKVSLDGDSFAVVSYTSGSTGEPKGVLRTHKMILHQAWTYNQQFGMDVNTRMLGIRPYGTTSSLSELFNPLVNGSTIFPFDLKEDGLGSLPHFIKSHKITMLRPPIQVIRSLLDILPKGEIFPDIQYIFATGDVLYRRDVDRLRKIIPHEAVIVHQLSMSEAGILAVNKINRTTKLDADVVPAGFPVKGKEVIILDENGNSLPQGEVGEIFIRTNFTFPGYWRAPDRSSARFLPDPLDETKKIFATGDLGRLRPDGQLEFQGRLDARVKIRGFSVDLSAIDAALQRVPGALRSVTVAQSNESGERRLVAFVQPVNGQVLSPSDLRKDLLQILPDYMVPHLFITVDDFPLTTSGKVDRKSLPLPDWKQSQSSAEYVAPRDVVEEKLVSIWQKGFDIERIGIHDNFFDLGGDSLLASALFVEIELAFEKRYPLSILLQQGTIADLAGILRIQNASKPDCIVALRVEGTNPPLFLVPGGGSDTITLIELVEALSKNQPVYGLEDAFIGTSRSVYADGIKHAAGEFINAIKQVQPYGPYYLGGHSFGGLVAFEMACQLQATGEDVAHLALLDTHAPVEINEVGTLNNRLLTHISNLRGRSPYEVIQYFIQRVKRRFSKLGRNKWVQKIYKLKPVENILWYDNRRYVQMAHRGYKPGIYEGDAVVYRATERPLSVTWDMTAAWPEFVTGQVEYQDVPGRHITFIKQPNAEYLARLMTEYLERVFEGKDAI